MDFASSRKDQLDILNSANEYYPDAYEIRPSSELQNCPHIQAAWKTLRRNITYLSEHRLIHYRWTGGCFEIYLTAAGIDFLADDGGLSAILNTVTVKFDAENIRSLIEDGVLRSNLPPDKKSSIKEKLKELPATALEKLTGKMIEDFLKDPSKAIGLITSAVGIAL